MFRARAVLSIALIVLVAVSLGCVSSGEKNDALAKCLTENGAKMYGAYWCQHCNNQKAAFGDSFKYIDYIECDPKGPNANPEACKDAGVQGYPTWVIGGANYPGEQDLVALSKISGCAY